MTPRGAPRARRPPTSAPITRSTPVHSRVDEDVPPCRFEGRSGDRESAVGLRTVGLAPAPNSSPPSLDGDGGVTLPRVCPDVRGPESPAVGRSSVSE